jgi:hypothetical protein
VLEEVRIFPPALLCCCAFLLLRRGCRYRPSRAACPPPPPQTTRMSPTGPGQALSAPLGVRYGALTVETCGAGPEGARRRNKRANQHRHKGVGLCKLLFQETDEMSRGCHYIGQAAQLAPQKNTGLPPTSPGQALCLRHSPPHTTPTRDIHSSAGRRNPRRRRTQHPSCYLISVKPPTIARPTGVRPAIGLYFGGGVGAHPPVPTQCLLGCHHHPLPQQPELHSFGYCATGDEVPGAAWSLRPRPPSPAGPGAAQIRARVPHISRRPAASPLPAR